MAGGRDRFPDQVKTGRHPPAPTLSLPLSPVASLLLFVFALSLLQLKLIFLNLFSLILRAFLDQNQSNLLQEVEASPIYRWVSFWRNFVGSICRILVLLV
jgi:hypothetical protein